jgi:hypothetical protein
MATNGNLPPNNNVNSTTEYFNNYFTERFTTSPNINDAVIGYFQSVTGDVDSGKALAATVIYTALSQGLEPMALVDEFKKLKAGRRVEVKTPIDATTIVEAWTSYDSIYAHKDQYEIGQLFYASTTNIFYRSYLDQIIEAVQIQTAANYKRETVSIGNGQYDYNYFYITYTQEQDELTPYLTVLLNQNRVNTSLLGISNTPAINKYIQRSILA